MGYPTVHRNWVFNTPLGSFVTGGFLGALVLTGFMVVSSELLRQHAAGDAGLGRGLMRMAGLRDPPQGPHSSAGKRR